MADSLEANLATGGYNDFMANAEFYAPVGRNLYAVQSAIIKKLAQKGSCVIVGRCADYVLKERENVVNLFVRASMSYRLQRAIVNYQVDEKKAADIIMKNDKRRRNYYNYHVGEKWADLNNYDLVIRSDMCGIDNAVKCIITYIGE